MYFPLAGIEVQPWVPPLAALVISFFTSMGGVSGAFLLLPFQMSVLGAHNPSLSATNQFYNIVAIPSGIYRYICEGRMVWPLAWAIVAGTLPGVLLGALVRLTLLPDKRSFMPFAAAVLAFIGIRVVLDIFRRKAAAYQDNETCQDNGAHEGSRKAAAESMVNSTTGVATDAAMPEAYARIRIVHRDMRRIVYSYRAREYEVRVPVILLVSGIVGIVGGIYGIGGGAIISPVLTSYMGLPVHTVAGAALLGTLATSVAGVCFYLALAPLFPHLAVAPDWMLGLLFGLGGMLGMYLGARCQKHIPAVAIKVLLACVLLGTAGKYICDAFAG